MILLPKHIIRLLIAALFVVLIVGIIDWYDPTPNTVPPYHYHDLEKHVTKIVFPTSGETDHCFEQRIEHIVVKATLDLGDDYEYGKNSFETSVTVKLTGFDEQVGGQELFSFEKELTINQNAPEQLFYQPITGIDLSLFKRLESEILSYETDPFVESRVRLDISVEEDILVNVLTPPFNADSVIEISPVDPSNSPIAFSFHTACPDVPFYQIQILKLRNTDPELANDPTKVRAIVDWSKALRLDLEEGQTTIKLHLAEGTGYYLWRVRPVGNFYEGDFGNNFNWGVWSESPEDGAIILDEDLTGLDYTFYYEQFDDDTNWIYNRQFSQGNRLEESVQYANGLNLLKQNQKLSNDKDRTLVQQILYDYAGRNVGQTLLAPTQLKSFGYQSKTIVNSDALYTAEDFDLDENYYNPLPIDGGIIKLFIIKSIIEPCQIFI